jgi:hypothetical protein
MKKDTRNRNLDLKTIQVLKFLFNPPLASSAGKKSLLAWVCLIYFLAKI